LHSKTAAYKSLIKDAASYSFQLPAEQIILWFSVLLFWPTTHHWIIWIQFCSINFLFRLLHVH